MDKDLVLSQFGKSKYLARREYRQFVLDGLPMGHQKKYYEVIKLGSALFYYYPKK
ncbi:MAG: hypothetical protein QME78_09515 [Thermodesulfobacteriota bacterium]|nr:hypothetical protein [Thermodesulfobacteriota bacterium]